MKATPGPWAQNLCRVESRDEHGWVNDGWIVAECHGPDAFGNAKLIAAAPQLLEALNNIASGAACLPGYSIADAAAEARAALAAATGEQA